MTQLTDLPLFAIDRIYSFLDKEDVVSLAQSCKYFFDLYKENEKYRKLSLYILERYSVVERSNKDLPFWLRLKVCPTFLIGENHVVEDHRKTFGTFINTIWQEGGFALFLEGGSKHPLGRGLLKYVRNEIGAQQQSWDLDPSDMESLTRRILLEQTAITILIGKFLSMCDLEAPELMDVRIEEWLATLKRYHKLFFPDEEISIDCAATLGNLRRSADIARGAAAEKDRNSVIFAVFLMRQMQVSLCLLAARAFVNICFRWVNGGDNQLAALNVHRDRSLEQNLSSAYRERKRAIAYGGIDHMIPRGDSFLKGISFMSLIPMEMRFDDLLKSESSCVQSTPREKIKSFTVEVARMCRLEEIYKYSQVALELFKIEHQQCLDDFQNYSNCYETLKHRAFHPDDLSLAPKNDRGFILNLACAYFEKASGT